MFAKKPGDELFLLEAEQRYNPVTYQRLLNTLLVSAATAKLKRAAAKLGAAPR